MEMRFSSKCVTAISSLTPFFQENLAGPPADSRYCPPLRAELSTRDSGAMISFARQQTVAVQRGDHDAAERRTDGAGAIKPTLLSITAALNSDSLTNSGVIACPAGPFMAAPRPSAKVNLRQASIYRKRFNIRSLLIQRILQLLDYRGQMQYELDYQGEILCFKAERAFSSTVASYYAVGDAYRARRETGIDPA